VKEFLSHAGVEFTAFNVDEDDRAYDALIARGYRTVPVTIAGDRIVRGFDQAALEAIVADWKASAEPPAR
jgi:glutaredoxin